MAGVSKGNPAGFHAIQVGTIDANNICTGQAGTTPANDTTSHMLKMGGGVSANFAPREPTIIEFRDADAFDGSMSFGGGDIQPFDVELEQLDWDAIALANSSSVDATTNSVWRISGFNPKNNTLPNMAVILTQRYQSRVAASLGQTKYVNWIFGVTELRFRTGAGLIFQDKNTTLMRVTPSMTAKFINGVSFGSNQGFDSNKTDMVGIVSDYPLAFTSYTGNGVATTFIAGYRPISAVVTDAATPNWYTEDGTAEALTSIDTTTGVATPDAAPAAAVRGALLYETEFVAI